MKRRVITLVVASAMCALSTTANAQFGKLMDNLGSGKQAPSSVNPEDFIKSAVAAEALMNNSVSLLATSLSSKEKATELKAQRKAANSITDASERQAKLTDLRKSEAVILNEALNNSETEESIRKMGSQQRDSLAAAAYNFMLALLQDKALLEQGQGLVGSLSSNPMNISKVSGVKDAMSSLSNQVSAATGIVGKMPAIFKEVGVKAPTSKDDKPKQVVQVDGE